MKIRGLGPWDNRILTIDPAAMSHVLKQSTIYEKPWQSRRLITRLLGCGLLSAEGQVHKRQRRVATPAFSIQNMRTLVPVVFTTGNKLKDRLMEIIQESSSKEDAREGVRLDMCHWVSRGTFDVIGLAGFDYHFNAIQNDSNELFNAYKDMFELALSQAQAMKTLLWIYFPFISAVFPDQATRTVRRCHKVIHRVAGHLIQEKKRKIMEGEKGGIPYDGTDVLSLLLKSNVAVDLPPEQRISDDDILHNINTLIFAGSDTSSLAITWTLLLLAQNPLAQTRLREELLSTVPTATAALCSTPDEIETFYTAISSLPYFNNVTREILRLVPPVHSSLRVATQDDVMPTSFPVEMRNGSVLQGGQGMKVSKGTLVHVPVEAFNLDKGIWGDDAWDFNPDRWDDLPEAALNLPWLFSNTLTFSAGPRSCIGMRFSIIEIKTFLYILLTNFEFAETRERIIKANVVLTRPYIAGKFQDGSQLPLLVKPYVREQGTL
jgi:cytochrome P450